MIGPEHPDLKPAFTPLFQRDSEPDWDQVIAFGWPDTQRRRDNETMDRMHTIMTSARASGVLSVLVSIERRAPKSLPPQLVFEIGEKATQAALSES